MKEIDLEELITKYGEEHRKLITEAIQWLESKESEWNLDEPCDREKYIEDLLSHYSREEI